MKKAIKYKDTMAQEGSDLYKLLTEAAGKSGKEQQELRKKAEQCYNDCEARYKKSIGG